MTSFSKLEITALVLVFIMALLQAVYAVYAYVDPAAFAGVRGTALLHAGDSDWVQVYASRTAFIALIIAYLLYARHWAALSVAALLGTVMPMTDAYLAFQAQAPDKVVLKHMLTLVYLLLTFVVLRLALRRSGSGD